MSKKSNTSTTEVKAKNTNKKDAIMGVLQLFVAVSIVSMIVIIWQGTDNIAFKAVTAPSAIYVALLLVNKFTK